MEILKNDFESGAFEQFPCCDAIAFQNGLEGFGDFLLYFVELRSELDRRFRDFADIRDDLNMFSQPFSIDCQSLACNSNIKLQLIQLQNDPKMKAVRETGVDFWKRVPMERYPLLRNFAIKMYSMFGSTYICESTFSLMKSIKSKERSSIKHLSLKNQLRVATTSIAIDFEKLAETKFDSKETLLSETSDSDTS